MSVHLFEAVILVLSLSLATQTRISELEMCKERLENIVSVVRTMITTVDNIELEKYLMPRPTNCLDLFNMGNNESGIYTIYPKSWIGSLNSELSVYCDMEIDGGGWIVLQRREDYLPRQNFFQDWEIYKRGFGQLEKEFWLGNENIHVLTNQENVTLRVDLEDFDGDVRYAEYDAFSLSSCEEKYKLRDVGEYDGTAGDSLRGHIGYEFVTFDNDNELGCASNNKGGWWYGNCYHSNLNGLYKHGFSEDYDCVAWAQFRGTKYSLKKSEMKIRPMVYIDPK